LGVDTTVAKTQALAISAFILGVAGSVYSMHYLFISPDSVFGFSTSISMVVMPLVGGIGTVLGPLLGAAIFTVLREQLEANFQNLDLLVFGVLLCAIVLFEPKGVLGLFNRLVRRRG
jgi:branched-chain amino acid transport system permease protein